MLLLQKIKELSAQAFEQTRSNRRHLHANPELSFEEYKTSAFVKSKLDKWGIPYKSMAVTGIEALVEGKKPKKKVVALRADMDALPIVEAADKPYQSKHKGIMHACGHDAHTASLLSSAYILHLLREDFEGTVKLIFQPGEEKIPGGASIMIKEGVLQHPAPSSIFAQHVMPLIPAGKVGFRKGMYMASTDELYLSVNGKGGHAALPDMNVDPVLMAAHIIVALQQIVSRAANPAIPSVLSFGRIRANGAVNIIPDKVEIQGTFRTLDEPWRAKAHEKMVKMAEGIAESMGGSCDIEVRKGYPHLENTPDLTDRAIQAAEAYLGKENVLDLDIWMAAEDFSYYSHEVDACFYRLGTRNEAEGIVSGVHSPSFDIDESTLSFSPGLMAWLALNELDIGLDS